MRSPGSTGRLQQFGERGLSVVPSVLQRRVKAESIYRTSNMAQSSQSNTAAIPVPAATLARDLRTTSKLISFIVFIAARQDESDAPNSAIQPR